MAPPILILRDIHLSFGSTPLLQGAELSLSQGDRLALVGRNGSGKSTLAKIAAGQLEPDSGERFVQPGTTLRYLPQEPDLSGHKTVLDYVLTGQDADGEPHRGEYLLQRLGLSGTEQPETLSGGEARRAALARAMVSDPDILLLDEPTNHLDLPAIQWLEEELRQMNTALILISHDRRFLANLTNGTVWLNLGAARRLDQGFAKFEAWRDEQLQLEELEQHKIARKIHREDHWLRYGVTARRKRNQRRLQALHDLRAAHAGRRRQLGTVTMAASEAEKSGKLVLEAKSINKSYDGRPIVADFSTRVQRGERIGIIGPNGAGKTTLLNILTGALDCDSGSLRLGAALEIVTLDQKRESLDSTWTLRQALSEGRGDMISVNGTQKHVVGYMKEFLFLPEQAGTPISALSGGERGRLMLARALAKASNFLILDEPTNDLDLETLDLLQEVLADYSGTVLLVSHDRDFLDRVVTSVIAFEGDGHWQQYAGGYSDMQAQRSKALSGLERPLESKPKVAKARSDGAKKPNAVNKLSYKDKHALEKLPGEMAALSLEITTLGKTMAAAEFFTRDPEGFHKTAERIQLAEAELAAAEERWLILEMLREELAG
jgi:ATP-binding cassette subfamily F protein uup